jgi:hypothetical protein
MERTYSWAGIGCLGTPVHGTRKNDRRDGTDVAIDFPDLLKCLHHFATMDGFVHFFLNF